jgi:hypothetical protein
MVTRVVMIDGDLKSAVGSLLSVAASGALACKTTQGCSTGSKEVYSCLQDERIQLAREGLMNR